MIDTERIAELIEYIVFLIVTHCGVKRLINCCTTALLLHVVSSACRSTVRYCATYSFCFYENSEGFYQVPF
jgi:hypothetical protein